MKNKSEFNLITAFYNLWFPRGTKEITIIAPPSYDGLSDAELTSSNYALMDRVGDRDSVYAMGKLLSRRYSKALIHLISSENLQSQSLLKNYVIIGGPGGIVKNIENNTQETFEGNEACRLFSNKIDSKVSYTDDCESFLFDSIKYKSQYNDRQYMTLDYGYFASFKNPFLKSTKVVMLHGSHTLGVLGSTRVFDGEEDSKQNYLTLRSSLKNEEEFNNLEFETFFSVDVTNGEVSCPSISASTIIPLRKSKKAIRSDTSRSTKHQSLNELKELIQSNIRIAIGKSNVSTKKEMLEKFLNEFSKMESISESQLYDVEKLCNANPSLPEDYVESMRSVLGFD